MWHNRSLRTRILVAYGLILGLASILALFLVFRIGSINQDMQQLNSRIGAETEVGLHMTRDVAEAQQAVSRYIQQPQPAHLQGVYDALRHLTTHMEEAQAALNNSAPKALLNDLKHQTQIYHSTFESVARVMKEQEPLRADVNTHIARSITLLNNTLALAQHSETDADLVGQLMDAQINIQQANLWIIRLGHEPTESLGANAIAEFTRAREILKRTLDEQGGPITVSIENTLTEIALATDLTNQLTRSIAQVQQLRDQRLNEQGMLLTQKADTIAQHAMRNLANTTSALAGEALRTQQITGIALGAGLALVLGLGFGLAQTITRPLREVVAATSRLNEGDYDVTVAQSDSSEIGQLAAIFNQMTTTLRQQRDQMLQQQAAIISRNQELERALAEIKTATEAQEALSATVRALTVPVVPILDNVIVVPLVGEIDEQRARTLLERLLEGISAQHASIAILDVTGVPIIDTEIVGWLLDAAAGVRLLGAQALLVGIRPEVAQAIVASGASLNGIITKASLQDAVEYALHNTAITLQASSN